MMRWRRIVARSRGGGRAVEALRFLELIVVRVDGRVAAASERVVQVLDDGVLVPTADGHGLGHLRRAAVEKLREA